MKLKYPELQTIIIKKVSKYINTPDKFRILSEQYASAFDGADLWSDYVTYIKIGSFNDDTNKNL